MDLDEKTLAALDELAEMMGMSRSKTCDLLLGSLLGTAENGMVTALVKMARTVKKNRKEKRDDEFADKLATA